MDIRGLSPEQINRLQVMLGGQMPQPGQAVGGAWDALNIGLNRPAIGMQRGIQGVAAKAPAWMGGPTKDAAGLLTRMAGSKPLQIGLKVGTGLGAVGGVLGAVDLVTGEESLANKAMDATAMGIGGVLGMAGGPVGAAAGAGVGKAISDGTQWLFGDKKTPQQRQLEQALINLQGGRF